MNLTKTKILLIITLLSMINTVAFGSTPPSKSTNTQTDNELTIPREIWPQNLDELLDYQNLDLLNLKFSNHFPKMNINETESGYHVEAELPGVKKDEIEIKLKNDYLVISGEKKSIREESKKQYRRVERSSGTFYRAVSIPRNIDREKITAELQDGILKIDIAKTKSVPESIEKKIIIK